MLGGIIPHSWEQLTLLADLQLGGNRLTGAIHGSSLQGMTSLTTLNCDGNVLSDKLPPQIGRMTKLRKIFFEVLDVAIL